MNKELQKSKFQILEDKYTEYYTKNNFQNLKPCIDRMFQNNSHLTQAIEGFSEVINKLKVDGKEVTREDVRVLRHLVFLAVVESEWDNKTSPAGAKGYYQFMPETAKELGLKEISNDNIKEQAVAAAKYLTHIYFDVAKKDLKLTLTAYNSGKTRLNDYIKKIGNKKPSYDGFMDYLSSIKKKNKENTEYAPKYFALIELMKKENTTLLKYARGEENYNGLIAKYPQYNELNKVAKKL